MPDRIKLEFVGMGPAKVDMTLTGFGLLTVGDQIVVNTEICLCLCQAYPEAFKALPVKTKKPRSNRAMSKPPNKTDPVEG